MFENFLIDFVQFCRSFRIQRIKSCKSYKVQLLKIGIYKLNTIETWFNLNVNVFSALYDFFSLFNSFELGNEIYCHPSLHNINVLILPYWVIGVVKVNVKCKTNKSFF